MIALGPTQIREGYSSAATRSMTSHRVSFLEEFSAKGRKLRIFTFSDDLLDLGEIGRGAFGTVNKMIFKKNNKIMAVKRIRCSNVVDEKEQKRIMVSGYPSVFLSHHTPLTNFFVDSRRI